MKQFFLLFSALLVTALAVVDQEKVKESWKNLKDAHDACNEDPAVRVTIEEIKKAHDEGGPAPANLPAHTLCVSKRLGWQNADGTVNEELIRSRIKAALGEGTVSEESIAECVKNQATPEATAKHIFDCYRKHTPSPGPKPSNL